MDTLEFGRQAGEEDENSTAAPLSLPESGSGGGGGGTGAVVKATVAQPVRKSRPCRLQLEFPAQPHSTPPEPLQSSPLSPISANPGGGVFVGGRKRRMGVGLLGVQQQQQQQQQQQDAPPSVTLIRVPQAQPLHQYQSAAFDQCDGSGVVSVETAQLPNVGPTEVLPHLYIGSQTDSLDAEVMRQFGITHVINVSISCPQSQHVADGNFMRIPVNDGYTDKLLPHFQRAFNFLERVRESSGRCLVHCLAGISRSPTLSIAYIMMLCGMSQDEAYRFVKQRRQHISPNFNFLGQLLEFERQLRRSGQDQPTSSATAAAAAFGDRPGAKRQRTSAGSPSSALSQLTFGAGVSRRPRSVLLGGHGRDPVPAIRRSRSTDAFLAAAAEAIEEAAAEEPSQGPVACLS